MNQDTPEIVIERLLPDKSTRKIILNLFLDAINQANALGKGKWGTYYLSDSFRLLMGSLIIFTIEEGRIWLALDKKLLEIQENKRKRLELSDSWKWDIDDYPEYLRVPSKNGYYTPSSNNHPELWSLIKEFHFSYLVKVAHKFEQLKTTSQAKHSPELLDYLQRELGQFVPQPDYSNAQSEESFALPEEVSEPLTLYEGSRQRISVNAYERNPKARQKCIEYYGVICSVCGFVFSRVYGNIGSGFIHVHHLKKISEIGEKYRVDPIRDL